MAEAIGLRPAYDVCKRGSEPLPKREDHMSNVQPLSPPKRAYVPPPVECDFYQIKDLLAKEERAILARVRAFMEADVAPIINEYWSKAKFPFELVAKLRELGIGGISYEGYGCAGGTNLLNGLICMEMARIDSSFATFYGVHTGLSMGSIYLCGSEEQKQRWLPAMARMEKIGAFGLTEPEVGSAASGGLTTTARRDGDHWILNGQKKWIGNATFADVTVIWARDGVQPSQGFPRREGNSRLYGGEDRKQDCAARRSERAHYAE